MTRTPAGPPLVAPEGASRALAWAVVAFVALWPFATASETLLVLMALGTMVLLVRRRLGLDRVALALCTVFFAGYWLPQLVSSVDAFNPGRAWREVAVDLRYLPFLCACAAAIALRPNVVHAGLAIVVGIWTLDGLIQAATGWSVGGISDPSRLTGVFGAGNPKLGLVLASLSPFLLYTGHARFGPWAWLGSATLVAVVVALSGNRAAWISYALVLAATGWRPLGGGYRAVLALCAGIVLLGVLGAGASDRFGERLHRSLAALSGEPADVDFALSGRLPIWRAALAMAAEYPVNGVGVRGFRDAWEAYVDIAPELQVWGPEVGASHAHQWVLEVLSETGGVGLLLWLVAISAGARVWWHAPPWRRELARPAALALVVSLFPLNTHLAVYSSFWGGLILLLAGLYAGAAGGREARGPLRAAGG